MVAEFFFLWGGGVLVVCWFGGLLREERGKYIGEGFPVGFHFRGGVPPLFADDFGDFGVGEAGILGDDGGLVVLAVEDEGWVLSVMERACKLELHGCRQDKNSYAYRFWAWAP